MNFFRPRGPPGAFWEPPGEPPGAQLAPKRAPEASKSHFGTILGAKMESRGLIFDAFLDTLGLYFGHLRPLLSQASRLCSSLGLGFQTVLGAPCTSKNGARKAAFMSAVVFRLRWRARGRFLFLQASKPSF